MRSSTPYGRAGATARCAAPAATWRRIAGRGLAPALTGRPQKVARAEAGGDKAISLFESPRVHEAAAATRQVTMAKSKAACRPDVNGFGDQSGEEAAPGERRGLGMGHLQSTAGPSRCCIGL